MKPPHDSTDAIEPAARLARPPRPWWLQYSLRGILIFISLIAVGLAFVGQFERPRRAVASIEKIGGGVQYRAATEKPGAVEAWLRGHLPRCYFDPVVGASLHGQRITDAELAYVEGLTSLKGLWLYNTQVTDAGIGRLRGHTSLELLYLNGTQISDASLVHLRRLTSLRVLDLRATRVTKRGVAELRLALPDCEVGGP